MHTADERNAEIEDSNGAPPYNLCENKWIRGGKGSSRRSGSRCSEHHTDVKRAEPKNFEWLMLTKRDVLQHERNVRVVHRAKGEDRSYGMGAAEHSTIFSFPYIEALWARSDFWFRIQ